MIGNADCPSGSSSLHSRNALVLAAGRDGDGDGGASFNRVFRRPAVGSEVNC
jgi:hypothetical protein